MFCNVVTIFFDPMFNYISQTGENITIIKQNDLITYNITTNTTTTKTYENNLIYHKENYVIDSKKQLHDLLNKKIIKLQKNITALQFRKMLYVCNRFGDVNIIENDTEKLLFGNLCMTTSMILHEYIWTGDKYGRVRVSDYTGKIVKYIFLQGSVTCMEVYNNTIYVCTTENEMSRIHSIDAVTFVLDTYSFHDRAKKIVASGGYLYFIGKRGVYKFRDSNYSKGNERHADDTIQKALAQQYDEVTENEAQRRHYTEIENINKRLELINFYPGDFIDGVFHDKEAFLTTNGDLIIDNDVILSLNYAYDDNYEFISR